MEHAVKRTIVCSLLALSMAIGQLSAQTASLQPTLSLVQIDALPCPIRTACLFRHSRSNSVPRFRLAARGRNFGSVPITRSRSMIVKPAAMPWCAERRQMEGEKDPGVYRTQWNAGGVPSRIYLYRLQTLHDAQTQKMLVLK
jgi:hypothetical protein